MTYLKQTVQNATKAAATAVDGKGAAEKEVGELKKQVALANCEVTMRGGASWSLATPSTDDAVKDRKSVV